MFPKYLESIPKYKKCILKSKCKSEIKKKIEKQYNFKRKGKKVIKIGMMCVTWPVNICLGILYTRINVDYTIAL